MIPTLAELHAAAEQIRPYAYLTPVRTCAGLDGLRVGVILAGGNVDLDRLPWT
jgi:threonine dehydratase